MLTFINVYFLLNGLIIIFDVCYILFEVCEEVDQESMAFVKFVIVQLRYRLGRIFCIGIVNECKPVRQTKHISIALAYE